MKFLDVKTDFAFKKVFGSDGSKDLLISFLNSVVDFDNQQTITDLTIKEWIYIQKSSIELATKTGLQQRRGCNKDWSRD